MEVKSPQLREFLLERGLMNFGLFPGDPDQEDNFADY